MKRTTGAKQMPGFEVHGIVAEVHAAAAEVVRIGAGPDQIRRPREIVIPTDERCAVRSIKMRPRSAEIVVGIGDEIRSADVERRAVIRVDRLVLPVWRQNRTRIDQRSKFPEPGFKSRNDAKNSRREFE